MPSLAAKRDCMTASSLLMSTTLGDVASIDVRDGVDAPLLPLYGRAAFCSARSTWSHVDGLPGSTVSKRVLPRGMFALRPGWNTEPHTERCVGEDGLVPAAAKRSCPVSSTDCQQSGGAHARLGSARLYHRSGGLVCVLRVPRQKQQGAGLARTSRFLVAHNAQTVGSRGPGAQHVRVEAAGAAKHCGREARARVGASAPATRCKQGAARGDTWAADVHAHSVASCPFGMATGRDMKRAAGVQGVGARQGARARCRGARAGTPFRFCLVRPAQSSHQPSFRGRDAPPEISQLPVLSGVFHAIRAADARAAASVARTVAAPCAVASRRRVTCSRRHASAARRGAPPEAPHRHLPRSDTTRPRLKAATRRSLRRARLCCRGAPALCGTWWRWRARLQPRQMRSAGGASAQRTRRPRAS